LTNEATKTIEDLLESTISKIDGSIPVTPVKVTKKIESSHEKVEV
jgi:hypothetical protein